MSKPVVDMSLDEIIKAGKQRSKIESKAKGKKAVGAKKTGNVRKAGGLRKTGKVAGKQQQPKKGGLRATKGTPNKAVPRRVNNNQPITAATKKLVDKLVKKALAQRTVRNVVRTRVPRAKNVVLQSPKIRAGRIVKRQVIASPLRALNQRSRVIARSSINAPAVRGRGGVRFNRNVELAPVIRRTTYVPNIVTRPVVVQQRPLYVQQQVQRVRQPPVQRQPARIFQQQGRGAAVGSVREHILQLKSGQGVGVRRQAVQKVVYVNSPQQQQPRRQQFRRRQEVVLIQQQQSPRGRGQQQQQRQRRNFGGGRRQQQRQHQQQRDPFYVPPNFLQRV